MVRIREPSFHAYAGFGLKLLSVSVAYAALVRIAMDWFSIDGMFGVFWPASGFALAVLLTGGRRYAWAVVLGTLLANALAGRADWATGIFAIDNALEALIAHALLNRQRQFVAKMTLS